MHTKLTIQITLFLLIFCAAAFSVAGQAISPVSRTGHSGKINAFAFSPDGKVLASASDDGTTRLWDVATGKELFVLNSKTAADPDTAADQKADSKTDAAPDTGDDTLEVAAVVFSPDGKTLATADNDGVHLWNPLKGILITTFDSDYPVTSLAFSPDGKFLAGGEHDSGDAESETNIADPKFRGSYLWSLATNEEEKKFDNTYAPVTFNAAGTMLATSTEKEIQLWDLKSIDTANDLQPQIIKLPAKSNTPDLLSFDSTGKTLIAYNSVGDTIWLWNADNGRLLRKTPIPSTTCLITQDRRSILINKDKYNAAHTPGGMSLIDVSTGKSTKLTSLFNDIVLSPASLSKDNKLLAVKNESETGLQIIDLGKKAVVQEITGYSINASSIGFSADGKHLVAAYDLQRFLWWGTLTGKPDKSVSPVWEDEYIISSLSDLSPDGKYFVVNDKSLYDAATGKVVVKGMIGDVAGHLAFSGDGLRLVVEGAKYLTVYEIPSGKVVKKFLHQAVFAKDYLNDGPVVTNYDGSVIAAVVGKDLMVWNPATGAVIRKFPNLSENGEDTKIILSPNGKFVVIDAGNIKVLNVENGKSLFEIDVYPHAFAVSPDNSEIATIEDDDINFFDSATGEKLDDSFKIGGGYRQIRFNKDRSLIAVYGEKGIKLLDGKTGKLLYDMK